MRFNGVRVALRRFWAILFPLLACTAHAQTYQAIEIGTLGGSNLPSGRAINSAGVIAGDSNGHAFLFSNRTMIDLGTLGGSQSMALGVNDSGQVTGWANLSSGDEHAFLYAQGVMTDLGTLGGSSSLANAINASGQIVGLAKVSSNANHPFLYSNGAMTDINAQVPGSPSLINDAGTIAGVLGIPSAAVMGGSYEHTYLYANGTATDITSSSPCCLNMVAYGLNASGQMAITGFDSSGTTHAYLYSQGALTQLGTFGGTEAAAAAINDNGWVVGYASLPGDQVAHAFLFANGRLQDINSLLDPAISPYITMTRATAINAQGWIVAVGTDSRNGQYHTYLLSPPISLRLTASTTTVAALSPVTLTWAASDPTAVCTPAGGLAGDGWSGKLAASGSASVTEAIAGPYSYALTCDTAAQTGQAQVSVTVAPLPPTANISANPTSITLGQPTLLTWTSANAAGCAASAGTQGDGWAAGRAANGSVSVTPTVAGTATYTVSCGSSTQSAVASTTVTVTVPAVTLSATETNLDAGQPTTLKWSSQNATACSAGGGTSGDGWTGSQPTSGSQSVTASAAALVTYTITCTAATQSVQASAQVVFNKSSGGGGGGALDWLGLSGLLGLLGLRLRALR